MTHILFYEKPGCGGNARQRAALEVAGHTLERRDLLGTAWTRESLLAFLAPLPVADWFNRSAPRIKSGELQPEALDREEALALLVTQPLLIRRPLMQRADDGSRQVGFDHARVDAWVGLASPAPAVPLDQCVDAHHSCHNPERVRGNRSRPPHSLSPSEPGDHHAAV